MIASGADVPEDAVYDQLTSLFRSVFRRPDLTLRPELAASDVAGWDSFKQIEIILGVEERYGFQFKARELDRLRNVGDLARLIIEKRSP